LRIVSGSLYLTESVQAEYFSRMGSDAPLLLQALAPWREAVSHEKALSL
jgi:hypothetical protein